MNPFIENLENEINVRKERIINIEKSSEYLEKIEENKSDIIKDLKDEIKILEKEIKDLEQNIEDYRKNECEHPRMENIYSTPIGRKYQCPDCGYMEIRQDNGKFEQ